jgi:hypothetical protein
MLKESEASLPYTRMVLLALLGSHRLVRTAEAAAPLSYSSEQESPTTGVKYSYKLTIVIRTSCTVLWE